MSAITLAILIIGNAGTAFADGGGNLAPTINAGALGVANTSSPSITSSVNLDGSDKSLTIALPLTLTDATGSGSGWKIQLATTQFHQAVDASPFHTLPTNATTFTGVTGVACGSNSTCQLPTNSVSSVTVPVQSATTDGTIISYGTATATSFYNAAANTGMGITNLSAGFNVALPANTTYAGGYSSTFTVTVVSAP
jgi:hypothetical protein